MRIFISWSSNVANGVALALKAWLPQLNPEFSIFVSSESIRPGKTWFDELRRELAEVDFGIGVFTPENLNSAWMFFEHGAIAAQKDFAPLLHGCKPGDLKATPASLFQAKELARDSFQELVVTLNDKCANKHSEEQLRKLYRRLWPELNKRLSLLPSISAPVNAAAPQPHADATMEDLQQYSDLELQQIFRTAKRRIDCFVLSGRNLFSPAVFEVLKDRINSVSTNFKVRILAMDVFSDGSFLDHRQEMMGSGLSKINYARDLDGAREYARNLALLDPEHKRFDVRFYHLMPTQFFFLIDDALFLTFVLSTPVGRCPVIKVNLAHHREMQEIFEAHFENYWSASRYFVSIVAFKPDGSFLMVKNRKRGWEWPGGFIEPNEDPQRSAIREFREESGYDIEEVAEVRRDASGTFYAGRLGQRVGDFSAREMEGVDFFSGLPKQAELSYPSQRATFAEVLEDARSILASQQPRAQ